MPIEIHGKQYVTVAERLKELHEANFERICIETEVLQHEPVVVIKATLTLDGNVYTGISAANPTKQIEKMSPYEVSETSAVGRACGFAGFGAIDSIASADEVVKASYAEKVFEEPDPFDSIDDLVPPEEGTMKAGEKCTKCGGTVQVRKSSSAKNPDREYWYCPIDKFSHWV